MKKAIWKQNHPVMGRKNLGPPRGGIAWAGIDHCSDVLSQRHEGSVFSKNGPKRSIDGRDLTVLRRELRGFKSDLEGRVRQAGWRFEDSLIDVVDDATPRGEAIDDRSVITRQKALGGTQRGFEQIF
jgi:hypothetical protein